MPSLLRSSGSGDDGQHARIEPKPETSVAFAHLREREAEEANRTPAQQQELREQARMTYQTVLAKDPNFVPALSGLADLYEKVGDHEKAVATYEKATEAAPEDPVVWYELALCHNRKKEWRPAIAHLRTALALDPDNRQCATTLGFTLASARSCTTRATSASARWSVNHGLITILRGCCIISTRTSWPGSMFNWR